MRKLITEENNVAISTVLAVAKQDIAIQNAINSLNELNFINRIEFEEYGKTYGLNKELLQEINLLQSKLQKIQYNRL